MTISADSLNFDSYQSFQVHSGSDWSASQAFGESQRKATVVMGTLIAKYDFQGAKESDLKFKAGDEIQVLRVRKNDWWVGQCKGAKGLFPINYMKKSVQLTRLKQESN